MRQITAAQLLVLGRTARDAARAIGVEEHSIGRWKKLPAFLNELTRQSHIAMAMRSGGRS